MLQDVSDDVEVCISIEQLEGVYSAYGACLKKKKDIYDLDTVDEDDIKEGEEYVDILEIFSYWMNRDILAR